jgi:GT2 family glycosyltransferase
MSESSIAVVLTCFNRKDKTESCLDALFSAAQRVADRVRLHVIVTDDGSSDGTGEMLRSCFPQVEVLRGDGSLFWNGGMRLAYGRALEQGHDFYLWLNDDTTLFPDCLEHLLATHEALLASTGRGGLVVGSTCNEEGQVSYGGQRRKAGGKALQFCLVQPDEQPQACDSANGNCLLVSAQAAKQLGNLEEAYVHCMGDMDYGLRATKLGIPLWVMPGFAGKCGNDHPVGGSYLDTSLPFSVRWKKVLSPKELSPRAWGVFCRRHAGPLWPVYWAWPYAKVVLTSLVRSRATPDRS